MRYLILFLMISSVSWATDFDDGIGYDEPDDDTIKIDRNIKYIVLKAKSKANRGKDDMEETVSSKLGNIEIGAGSNLKGATIINMPTIKEGVAISEGK